MDALSDIVKGSVSAFVASWTRIKKASDTTRSSNTTLSADPDLQFSMAASTKYAFRARVFFDTNATADFKWRHVGPASPTLVRIHRVTVNPNATAFSANATDTAFSAADIAHTGTGTNGGYIEIEGVVHNGGNADTFSFQWAQNTSSGSTSVLAGSYLEYMVVA